MKIFFSKKEYRLLVDMISLADWMIFANETPDNKKSNNIQYRELINKIYSYSKDMQCNDCIQKFEDDDKYYTSDEHTEEMHEKFVEDYDNEVFWSELASRLAKRDLVKEFGLGKCAEMDRGERFTRLCRLEEKYQEEFDTNNIEKLVINE